MEFQSPFEEYLSTVPDILRNDVAAYWQDFSAHVGRLGLRLPDDGDFFQSLCRVWASSEFVARACIRDPGFLVESWRNGDLKRPCVVSQYPRRLASGLEGVEDEEALGVALRVFRRREMVRIAWRDLAGWADLDEVLPALSALADACVDGALRILHGWQQREWGVPTGADGTPQSLVVLAMGKLGGRELNFSSDIDLIFAYPQEGWVAGPRAKSNSEYFTRLGRRLIRVLDERTAEGFVFRVDMRLRPYGDSGPLAVSFDFMEDYYQSQGRDWERYAMIKARPITGDPAAGEELMKILQPFVYRRYLDYGVFESLREMKWMVAREVERKGMREDIKLGPGGIREVEFIGQAFQLIRGGREPRLRTRGILDVLAALGEMDEIDAGTVVDLRRAYEFLRRTENRLQAHADEQTQRLPDDDRGRLCLAYAMGYGDWDGFAADLARHRSCVQGHFERIFNIGRDDEGTVPQALDALWRGGMEEPAAIGVLEASGFDRPQEALRRLEQLRHGRIYLGLGGISRERMDRFIPMLLDAAGRLSGEVDCLGRLITLVESIARRSAYIALLSEMPEALNQLVRLVAASPWIATFVSRHPILLDELLDPRTLYAPMDRHGLAVSLKQRLAAVETGDLEQEMEALRHFKQAHVLRVAATDIMGATPLMKVSDYLSWIAEVLLEKTLELAWRDMTRRYGRPCYVLDGEVREAGFAVAAYGKLGGIELGYGSDLDVVFLHDSRGGNQYTDGERSVDNHTFFARMAQRMIHILTTPTSSGELYEIDMRLRPSGASGLLVSSLSAFDEYQRQDAWTWEHQALVRARVVAGSAAIAGHFAAIRAEILRRARDVGELRREVREMRERMRRELAVGDTACFDLKQGHGGIADIEFMVQYGVLAWAHDHPDLVRFTDNIRILEGMAREGLLEPADARLLADAYRAFRARSHRLVLQDKKAVVGSDEFTDLRAGVQRLWARMMSQDL